MQRVHATIGLAALMGAALVSSPALAVTAFSPTGNLNVRSGPGFQYQVMNQISANVPVEITGCVSDYSWCSVALPGGATGWASAPYLVTKAAGQAKNMSVVGAQHPGLAGGEVRHLASAPGATPLRLGLQKTGGDEVGLVGRIESGDFDPQSATCGLDIAAINSQLTWGIARADDTVIHEVALEGTDRTVSAE